MTTECHWTLNSQKYPYTPSICPWCRNFRPFHSTTNHVKIKGCTKSECIDEFQNDLTNINVKIIKKQNTLSTRLEALFRNGKYTEWLQNDIEHFAVKCTLSTYPWGPKSAPFHPTTSRFQEMTHLIILQFPNDYNVKHFEKRTKKFQRIQNVKFQNSLNNFGRDPPQEYTWDLGSTPGVYFQGRYRLKPLLPYSLTLTKTKKRETW